MAFCPKCGGPVYYRPVRGGGSFYSCRGFPECRGKISTREVYLEQKKEIILMEKRNKEIQKAARLIARMHNAKNQIPTDNPTAD